jgi:hypothetical protein
MFRLHPRYPYFRLYRGRWHMWRCSVEIDRVKSHLEVICVLELAVTDACKLLWRWLLFWYCSPTAYQSVVSVNEIDNTHNDTLNFVLMVQASLPICPFRAFSLVNCNILPWALRDDLQCRRDIVVTSLGLRVRSLSHQGAWKWAFEKMASHFQWHNLELGQ